MRFDSLNIPAFGPFTSCSFEFPRSKHDLHVIYGANEAGKSSLLRGIHNLLYGFPASTEDNFLHDYKKLRIGATVSDGEQRLTFLRKKGNVGTLLDQKQNTIDEGKLKAFCGTVSPEFFRHMFGLSTETLRSGAASLLSAKGEMGALLFAASVGGSPIESAIEKLQDEADKLFAGNGRRANTIVAAYNKVKDHEKESRALSISTSDWKKLNQAIEAAQKDFDHKDGQLTRQRTRLRRVENLIKAIPLIHEVKVTNAELATIVLPQLSSDFPTRVAKASSVIAEANALINEYTSSLNSKKTRLAEIKPFQQIVDDAPELDSLHQNINQHLSDLEQIEMRTTALQQHQDEQHLQLQKLNLRDIDALASLPDIEKQSLVEIRQLAESIAKLERERDQIQRDLSGTDRGITKQNAKLDELSESEPNDLLRALSVQVKEHNQNNKVAADWAEKREECHSTRQQLKIQLGIADLPTEDAVGLQVPALAVIEEYHKDEVQVKEDLRLAHKELDDFKNSALEIRFEIKAVSDDVAVVSEADLVASRAGRDEHWKQLAAKLVNKEGPEKSEPESFAKKVSESDEIADTLRDHAETIGKVATMEHRLEVLSEKQKQGNETVARLEEKHADLKRRWMEHSSVLPNRQFMITELIAWRGDWEKYCKAASESSLLERKLAAHEKSELELQDELRQSLHREDANYAVLSDRLNATLSEAESLNGERKAIRADIQTLNAARVSHSNALVHADEVLADALCEWSECIAALKLDKQLSKTAAVSTLEDRHTAHATDREIADCQREVELLAERIRSYTDQLERYRSRHLPDSPVLDPANPEVTEQRLAELLTSARVHKTEFETLVRDIGQVDETLSAKQKSSEAALIEIRKLISEAKLGSEDGLPDAVIQFESRAKLQQKLEVSDTTLTNLAGSQTLEGLIEQANGEESDALHIEVQKLLEEIEASQSERDIARDVLKTATDKRSVLERATDDAAIAKQFAANALATVITDSERFIRLQHSISFLKDQVEAYRKKSQGPMVDKTSGFFRTLTDGAFRGVGAQPDEDDANQINLVALKDDPEHPGGIPDELRTQALSEGTRDQLYLALRMAAIDIHLYHHAPMPLILDDVLMTFDDCRSQAFFELMKTLSRKTQVIVFTHHQHTAKMAESFVPADQILQLP